MWTKSSQSSLTDTCVEVLWRKSSLSGNDGQCVEVGVWKKSTRSGPWTDNCVEVSGTLDDQVLVRDTKNPDAEPQCYTRREWLAFIGGVKLGEFDLD